MADLEYDWHKPTFTPSTGQPDGSPGTHPVRRAPWEVGDWRKAPAPDWDGTAGQRDASPVPNGTSDSPVPNGTSGRDRAAARDDASATAPTAVPLAQAAAFLPAVEDLVGRLRPAATPVLFGHLADGNVHVNLLGVADDDTEVDDAVVGLVVAHGGHASAEHGIGVLKNRWLGLTRSPSELAVLARLRDAFDPDRVLNPRVLRPV